MLPDVYQACPEPSVTVSDPRTSSFSCSPWPCAPGRTCSAHAPRISPADAAPLLAIWAEARRGPLAVAA